MDPITGKEFNALPTNFVGGIALKYIINHCRVIVCYM